MKENVLDQYNPDKASILVYIDKDVKAKLKEGAKRRGVLLRTYINRILKQAVHRQNGLQEYREQK